MWPAGPSSSGAVGLWSNLALPPIILSPSLTTRQLYPAEEALRLVKEAATANFVEGVDVAVRVLLKPEGTPSCGEGASLQPADLSSLPTPQLSNSVQCPAAVVWLVPVFFCLAGWFQNNKSCKKNPTQPNKSCTTLFF